MALKILVIVFAVIIIVLLGVFFFYAPAKGPTVPSAPAGAASSSVMSTDGTISVDASLLAANGIVASPLVVTGSVYGGGWFFEATFPVKILDGDGTVLGTSFARAGSDWMSTGTVPFRSDLTFSPPKYATGQVIFNNDNPSGDPSKLKTFSVPVRFQ